MNKSRTLITGGSGMVGSQFDPSSILLTSTNGDLIKQKDVKKIFNIFDPEYVIHTAARVGGVGANIKANAEFFYDNVMMNTNVIEACKRKKVKRAAFFLSTCVFPDKIEYPLTEDKIHLGPGHPSNYGYSYAKRMAEVQVRSYNEQYGTKYFCVIPCNIYGPGDNFSLENGHVIPALIHKVYLAKQNNTDLEVWGDGSPMREFIYSNDIAKITEKLLYETDFTGNIIISNPEEISIKHLVSVITEMMGFKGKVIWRTDKPNGQLRKPSSIKKLEEVVGPQNFVPLYSGLAKTIEWFERNYPNVRK